MQNMMPTDYEKAEWARCAQAAYSAEQQQHGDRLAAAASLPAAHSMPIVEFYRVGEIYRRWLVFNEWLAAHA